MGRSRRARQGVPGRRLRRARELPPRARRLAGPPRPRPHRDQRQRRHVRQPGVPRRARRGGAGARVAACRGAAAPARAASDGHAGCSSIRLERRGADDPAGGAARAVGAASARRERQPADGVAGAHCAAVKPPGAGCEQQPAVRAAERAVRHRDARRRARSAQRDCDAARGAGADAVCRHHARRVAQRADVAAGGSGCKGVRVLVR
mmetsp:Transcript_19531/g.69143  ORF Transcript_19531/g.69143 Transcript_19531/m.69143 type:complete len:206 (-) Transcript_19531:1001-1618(-)